MSVGAIFAAMPMIQRIRARHAFVPCGAVPLRHWWQLDAASGWCERRWRDDARHYRRTVRVADCQAEFEFGSDDDTVEFLLRFG